MRPYALLALIAVLAGCGAQKPVEHKVAGDFTGFDRRFDLPRGYGVRCDAAMRARRSGEGDGATVLVNRDGVQLLTAALRFSDDAAAARAYAASLSAQAGRCYADGFVAELVRRFRVRVVRVKTGPWKVDPIGDERAGTRVTVVLAGNVTLHADTAVIRTGSALSLEQAIDISALRRPALDLRLVEALS
jgi:hypothetical protein